MLINDALIQNSERIIFTLQQLYLEAGFTPYRMSKFEEYDLYAKNKDFLLSDNVITFTDTTGKLMALKPDVTLSIINNSPDLPDELQRVFYRENVYRVSKSTDSFKEIMQAGLECIGAVTTEQIVNIIELAVKSLAAVSDDCVLEISYADILESVINSLDLSSMTKKAVYESVAEKNIAAVMDLCKDAHASLLLKLIDFHSDIDGAIDFLNENDFDNKDIIDDFVKTLNLLKGSELAHKIQIDFSVVGDGNYYNGIIFRGFIKGVPAAVLSGGQYDRLMKKMKKRSKAIGFAVYTDLLDRVGDAESESFKNCTDDFLNVALPKGRLGEKVYDMFAKAGFECPEILEPNRKLFFENPEKKVRYFWVKPSDVAIYVERGAADIGVAGKDILLEYEPDVYELLDMNMGKCRMAVAGKKDVKVDESKTIRVATKFSNIANKYYRSKGKDIDIIHLNGSIEIAPLLMLSDVIVDIVETGATLKENNLEVKEEICNISARLIANKASFKFRSKQIEDTVKNLSVIVEEAK